MAYSVGGESSSSSDTFNSTPNWKYDVFLSFAGKDTRLKFLDHLYEAFNRSGIKTFRDDVDLERGDHIKQGLFQAIQNSLCAVVVISENYANSTWCLDELQKILESQNAMDRRVFPIFYDVDPTDVRHQRKRFREALAEHEEKFMESTMKVQNWKNALFEISNLSGWDTRGTHEADLIKNIVGEVWTYLYSKLPSYDDNLVGIDSRLVDMMQYLEIGSDEVHFVGIWGMGGVGKTTLARVVFEKLSYKFEVCCFLANVRETMQRKGILSLQKRLLSHLRIKGMKISDDYEGKKMIRKLLYNKKVLLVLDDLDNMSQLKNLAQSPNWFGKGSRIIITTRDSQLLTSSRAVQKIYEMKTMKQDESLQLFSNKAFDKDNPDENYLKLSKSVVKYTGGLPLALEVLGSFLCGKSEDEWRDALDRLKQIPDKNILQVLKISYDGLNEEEKTIFLDIACFSKHWQKKKLIEVLESCDLHPTIGIKVLIEKTLLVETKDTFGMHDLFEDLARYIIHQESPNSRLWKFDDIKEVLENNKGYEAIQAIVMFCGDRDQDKIKVHPEAFAKMSNLRLLSITGPLFRPTSGCLFLLPRGLTLPGALKVVGWHSFPFEALPLETSMNKLVEIQMPHSKIKQLWNGIQFMRKLKFIDLRSSKDLIETPDFSGVPNLEYLCLSQCTSLVKVHPSLGELRKLAEVCLDCCYYLEILPRKLETNSLIKLDLSFCGKLAVLPEFGVGMKKLSYLDVGVTAITRLPKSFGSLTGLRYLNWVGGSIIARDEFWNIHVTRQIPTGLHVTSLTELYLSGCGLNDGSIPDDFGSLSSLIVLSIGANDFVNLPTACFSRLSRLLFLSLGFCKRLKSLPMLPPRLIQLNARNCDSMEPLSSDREIWNLVASLDHEYRGQTKYVIPEEDKENIFRPLEIAHVEPEFLPMRDFFAIIRASREIPSWFPNTKYYDLEEDIREYEIKVSIPPYCRDSEWSGIVVCCFMLGAHSHDMISWSSKAVEDDYYTLKELGHRIEDVCGSLHHMCIMILELNEKTCWQHLRGHNNSLHIKLSTNFKSRQRGPYGAKLWGCGWRVICKEEIQDWHHLNDFNQQLTPPPPPPPPLASPHDDEVKLPRKLLHKFIGKMDYEEMRKVSECRVM